MLDSPDSVVARQGSKVLLDRGARGGDPDYLS